MGLSIAVGLLNGLARDDPEGWEYQRSAFAKLKQALAGRGVDWREPGTDPAGDVFFTGGFPYSYPSHLRRAFVLRLRGETVTPARAVDTGQHDRDQEKVHDESSSASHAGPAGRTVARAVPPGPWFLSRDRQGYRCER